MVVDGEGNSWKYDHDGAGNVISAIDAEGHETRIEWTEAGQPSIIHFADGGKEQRFYDQHHRLIEIILANGGKVRLERDIFGRVISEQSPDGSLTRVFYDHSKGKEFYQPTRIERPDGSVIERKFDAEGQVSHVKDAQGRQWTYHYGPFDLLLGMQEPGGGQLSFEYDVLKRLTCVKDALQRQWHLERDVAGRIIHDCDFAGQNFYYHYDDVGNVIKRINADNSFIEYSYDKTGLLLLEKAFSAQGDLQETTSFDYDGRQLLKRAENGSSVIGITRDKNGRIIQEGCNGRKITSQFDAMGRRVSYQIGQNFTKFYHDPLGSLTQLVIGNHKPMDFQYNIMGRETQRQSHSGFSLNQSYDALGLLTNQEAGFALSTLGRRLEGARAAQLRGFDAVKAAAQVKRDYSWNKAFEPLSIKDQRWGETHYSYDDNGQITKASSSDGRVEQFNCDPARNITGFSDENNILSHWQQAKGGRITDAKGANGEHIALEYDACNRIIKRIVTRNGFRPKIWHYQWDAKDRLIGCSTPTGERWTYHYDPFGRRIFKINASIAQKALLAQSPQITEIEKTRGAYHEDSHQRSSGELSNDTIVGTAYLWNANRIAEEAPLKASGEADWDKATKWHYEPDTFRPIAKETANGELFYIVNDHLGTPREMFSEDGKLVWAAQYRTWGAVHKIWQADNDNDIRGPYPPPMRGNLAFKYDTVEAQAAQACPIRFQGQWEDVENGLYYNRYRYYDPLAAQYISPDPIGLAGGLRPNGYVHNPNTWIDPWGLAGNVATATHVTYTGIDIATGKPYIGYASMPGHHSAEEVIKYRYSGNYSRFGGEPPTAIYQGYGWEGKQIARGLEQIEFEKNGGLKGTANKQNPVGKNNKNRAAYLSKAEQHLLNQAKASKSG
ncbi:RHS repeat-associated core domain-containing protein [Bartonella sp. HY406]|uniref:RHS repeat-associated core domain-containing protein n=1 Tax=Bartonella sp. HY406 TaxID=2979331 RepID=UPI0021C968A7|nr:RHS repeat-associated core domain-containing protein [Bartonella sp. HY406]UXN02613.1 RHS domain-containing protein [Bartonella sp. HY406]